MGIVARVVLYKLCAGTDTNFSFPFELPFGMDAEEADSYLARDQPVHGRRLILEPPTEAWSLGLDEADGEMIRMVKEEWDWVVMPNHVLRVEPWEATRVGRWTEDEAEAVQPTLPTWSAPRVTPSQPQVYRATDYVALPTTKVSRLAPSGEAIPIVPRPSHTRPEARSGETVGIVVWVQTYSLKGVGANGKFMRGHSRFHHFYFQVADATVPDARRLAALLESGASVPGWRVTISSGNLSGLDNPPARILTRRPQDLVRDDVRMFRQVERPLTLNDMEHA